MEYITIEECCDILDSRRIPITASDRRSGPYPYYGANGIQDYVAEYIFDDELVLLAEDGGNFGSKTRPIAYRVSGKCWVNNHAHVLKPMSNMDVNYLCYSLMFYDTEELVNGATRQKLTQAAMRKMLIPQRPIKEQEKIVSELSQIQSIISARQRQLQKLDELVKARFVEMFGTETELDKWHCETVSDVADVCVGVVIKPTQYYANQGVPAFRSLNIGEMRVKDADWVYFTEEGHRKNQKSVVRKNDVLVVRSGAPGTACVATEKYVGYNAVDIIIAHPDNNKVNSIFLAAFTNMPHGMNQIRTKTGGAAQQHFNVGGYKSMRLIMPPLELQEQFAAFVEQANKSKDVIQKALDEAQLLFDSLMQKYFGCSERKEAMYENQN